MPSAHKGKRTFPSLSLTLTYPSQLPIPYRYLSLTGTYPLQVPMPYSYLSLAVTYPLQLPIPFLSCGATVHLSDMFP